MWSCVQFPGTATTSVYVATAFRNLEHYYYFTHEGNLKDVIVHRDPNPLRMESIFSEWFKYKQ